MNNQFTPMDYNINRADRKRAEHEATRKRQAQKAQKKSRK